MSLYPLLSGLGTEIEDPEEESFLLFAQTLPSSNLGFIDAKATELEISVGSRDFTIHQSPTVLNSNRDGGTTGAVLWKVTPLFAAWLSNTKNAFFQHGILSSEATVLELGCGISGLVALSLSPHIARHVLTDQSYVMKLLHQNLAANSRPSQAQVSSSGDSLSSRAAKGRSVASKKGIKQQQPHQQMTSKQASHNNGQVVDTFGNISTLTLDWELTLPPLPFLSAKSPTIVLACDCIYNEALIAPLNQTCAALCREQLRLQSQHSSSNPGEGVGVDQVTPPLALIAQQLRSPDVFEAWIEDFSQEFRVWRVPDEMLPAGLKSGDGFVVHAGILREIEIATDF